MKRILLPIFAFILTACGISTPQVTVTSQVTVTLTASATPTVTFTPTLAPAFSPEVDAIMGLETTPAEVRAFLTAAKEGGLGAKINADNTINLEGNLNINPLTGETNTSHPLTLDDGRVIQVATSGQVGVDVTIETDAEGNTVINTPAWRYTESDGNGEWEQETIVRKSDNMETGIPKYTREEMMAAVLSENEWLEKTGQMGEESVARLWDKQRGLEMVRQGMGNGSRVGVVSNDIEFPSESKFYFDNEMYRTKDGKWLEDVATTFHVRTYLPEQDVTIVRWAGEGENGEMVVKEMMVDGDWVDPNFFKENNMSFFNFEKGSEFDLTFLQQ